MPIDITLLRAEKGGDPDMVRASQKVRGSSVELVDKTIAKDNEWRKLTFKVENLKKEQGELSNQVKKAKQSKQDASAIVSKIKDLKAEMAKAEEECKAAEHERHVLCRQIANLTDPSVPPFISEDDNVVEFTYGQCRPPTKYHHHELLHMIDGYSSAQGVNVAGHRGYFLKGCGVLLNQALINYGLGFLMKHGYTPLQPPFFMKKEIMAETAQLEEFDEALYKVTGDGDNDKYLIATSEQPISAYHRKEWLQDSELPKRYAGYSTCFRKEAGSHGRDTWGIFRIHQFEKVEQFVVTRPEDSKAEHDKMVNVAKEYLQSLGLSYRVVNVAAGELNNAAAKKYDIEAWFPTLGVYRELVSASNCTDYQARAMETRYGQQKGKVAGAQKSKEYVHMLNSTLCATERTICCLLENYQTEEGVAVPEVLQPYMCGIKFMPFVQGPPENKTQKKQEAKKDAPKKKEAKKEAPKKEAPKKKSDKKVKAAPTPKKEEAKAAPAPAPAAAAGGDLPQEVTDAANKVRDLKASGADPAEVKAAVVTLLALKEKHGIAPPPKSKKDKKKKKK